MIGVKLDTGASCWGGGQITQAARAESGFGGGEAYQNTKLFSRRAGTGRLDGEFGSRQQQLVFFSTAVTHQFPHV